MKKGIFWCVILMLTMAVLVFSQVATNFALAEDKPALKVNVVGGSRGGIGLVVMESLVKVVQKAYPNINFNVTEGGFVENIPKVNAGDFGLGSTTKSLCALAEAQKFPYTSPQTNLRSVFAAQDKVYYFALVKKDIPVETVSDLVNKKLPLRLFTLKRGNVAELMWRVIFDNLGVTWGDLSSWGANITFGSWAEGVEKIKKGEVDVILGLGIKKLDWIEELSKSVDMKIINWDNKLLDLVQQKFGFEKGVIPMGTYSCNINYDIISPTDTSEVMANVNVPDDVIYAIVKTLAENSQEYASSHVGLGDFQAIGMPNVKLPLHPGAKKYYQEKGYIK